MPGRGKQLSQGQLLPFKEFLYIYYLELFETTVKLNSRNLVIASIGVFLLVGAGFLFRQTQMGQAGLSFRNSNELKASHTVFRDQSFDVVTVDPQRVEVRLFWKNEKGEPYQDFSSLADALAKEGKQLLFATNAGIFSEDFTPGGLHVENGEVLKNLNLRDGQGNFHMKPNGVFVLGAEGAGVVESEAFTQKNLHPTLATQSGPMLVMDGKLHPAFNEGSSNKYIRNGVGVDKAGRIHFAISNARVNFFDFASLFRDNLDCPDALYLDGSISEFYCPQLNRYDSGGGFCGILAVVE